MPDHSLFAVDIDGVVCAHAEAICHYVEAAYGVKCSVHDVTTWDHDFGPVTFVGAVKETYPDHDFVLSMEPRPGAVAFLQKLRDRYDVILASTRKPYCHEATREWVTLHFGDLPVEFVGSKTETDAVYLLDDYPQEVLAFAAKGRFGYLLRRPWNDSEEVTATLARSNNCRSVTSLEHVLETATE